MRLGRAGQGFEAFQKVSQKTWRAPQAHKSLPGKATTGSIGGRDGMIIAAVMVPALKISVIGRPVIPGG